MQPRPHQKELRDASIGRLLLRLRHKETGVDSNTAVNVPQIQWAVAPGRLSLTSGEQPYGAALAQSLREPMYTPPTTRAPP